MIYSLIDSKNKQTAEQYEEEEKRLSRMIGLFSIRHVEERLCMECLSVLSFIRGLDISMMFMAFSSWNFFELYQSE